MPKKPIKSPDEIYNSLKTLNFINDGNYLPYNAEIWQDAVILLDGAISKDYIFQYITQNRNQVSYRIHGDNCLLANNKQGNEIKSTNKNCSSSSNWSITLNNNLLDSIRATIYMGWKQWQQLESHTKIYNEREYKVLQPGWSGRIYNFLLDNYKLPCPFAFKNAKINKNPGNIFLDIKGACPECHNKIHLFSLEKPNQHGMDFHISTLDTREIIHYKKKQLQGNLRKEIATELKGKTTYNWLRETANKNMNFGDNEPANMYSANVLRKAKQQHIDKELGVGPTSNPIQSVMDLKNNAEFAESIREVGGRKFYIMYWTPEQLKMYKLLIKNGDGIISIDATGSIVASLPTYDGSKSTIFLYQAVGRYKGKTLPIFQAISEKHDTNFLQYWIREWLRSGVPVPKQIVTDMSLALLNACSLAFTNKSLSEYCEKCFEEATTQNYLYKPMCLLRIDIAHLIHLISRWSCFHNISYHIKDFFIKCIGILSNCTTIDNFFDLSTKVLIVAKSEFEDVGSLNNSCYIAQQYLIDLIKRGCNTPEKDVDLFVNLTDFNKFEERDDAPNNIREFLNQLVNNTVTVKSGDRLNPYYCPNLERPFLRLCKFFLLWTAIMPYTYFNSNNEIFELLRIPSSARSESYFKDLKKLVFEHKRNVRVDKAVIIHLRSSTGTMKLLYAMGNKETVRSNTKFNDKNKPELLSFEPPLSSTKMEMNQLVEEESSLCFRKQLINKLHTPKSSYLEKEALKSIENDKSYLNKVDSWKGLLKETKQRGLHLRPCPDIENIHKRPKYSHNLPLLVNGSSLLPVNTDRGQLKVTNTCAFDSVMHCLRAGYVDWFTYHDYINKSENGAFKFIQQFSNEGATRSTYTLRAKLLLSFKNPNAGILDCECNVGNLVERIICEPSSIVKRFCSTCNSQTNLEAITISPDLNPLYQLGLTGLQEALDVYAKPVTHTCIKCNLLEKTEVIGGAHLVIDIESLQWGLLAERQGCTSNYKKKFRLSEVPADVNFCNYKYKCVGVIVYVPGHYVSYIKRISTKWEIHDGLTKNSKIQKSSPNLKNEHSIHILFYVKID